MPRVYSSPGCPGQVAGLVIVDPLGAVPDGGLSDMEQKLAERIRPELTARARELAERAAAGQGTAEDALESLAIVWPGYFSSPQAAPPMPPLSLSVECYAGTFASIQEHFGQHTLERSLPALTVTNRVGRAELAAFWISHHRPAAPRLDGGRAERLPVRQVTRVEPPSGCR